MTKKIIFKCDDFCGVSENVIRFDDIVLKHNLRVAWGIVGHKLENMSRNDIEWVKQKNAGGLYEFWNHGYSHDFNEFTVAKHIRTQYKLIEQTQKLAKERLGFELQCFGAPCNVININTGLALLFIPEIKGWLYGKSGFGKCVFRRYANMEFPAGNPDFEKFKNQYEKWATDKDLVTYQLHPNMWSSHHFDEFEKEIDFFEQHDVAFVLPKDIYL